MKSDMLQSNILLVTGLRQVGKSTVVARAVTRLQDEGLRVSGLLTARTGPHDLMVTELHTGARYPLTDPFVETSTGSDPRSTTRTASQGSRRRGFHPRHFTMNSDAMARSRAALTSAFPTQVFVLDEVGPLELRVREGWIDVLDLLGSERYEAALIVVRPELLGDLVLELPGLRYTIIRVTLADREWISTYLAQFVTEMITDILPRLKP